jgi:myo-inositol 2-dehydrogenase / D-chiro-inositol 1-dehydrogenase
MDAGGFGHLMPKPLRAAQIGAGTFCHQFHAPTLQRLASGPEPRISLEAICDLDHDRTRLFAREFGYARVYDDFRRMIDEVKPGILYCMVQPSATAAVVEQLLTLRIPLFTEKPPGVTVAQAEKLAALAAEHRVLNYVAFNRRAMPGVLRLKQWVMENGPIRYARAEMLRNRRLEPEFGIGTAIHPLDCLRFLCGDVASIVTRCNAYPGTAARDFIVRLNFDSGAMADLTVLVDCGVTREQYFVHAQNQMMEVSLSGGYSSEFWPSGEKAYRDNALVLDTPSSTDPLVAGGFVGEHNAFLDGVEMGVQPLSSLQDARHSLRLAMAVHEEYSGRMEQFVPRPCP